MALGFSTEAKAAADILPIIKWDAKGGDMVRVDRYQDSGGSWIKDEKEMDLPVKFVADLDAIEVGWLSFASGVPDFRMVRIGEAMPERPSAEHKNAFRVRIYNKELGLREFSHSAKTVVRQMDSLHNQFIAERQSNTGKMPVVEVSEAEVIKINTPQGEGRFKIPKWRIVSWVDRPAEMAGSAPEPVVEQAARPRRETETRVGVARAVEDHDADDLF